MKDDRLEIRLESEIKNAAQNIAGKKGWTLSQWIRELIIHTIKTKEKK